MTHTPTPTDSVIGAPTATLSVRPVLLRAPDRGDDLQVRVTAPRDGEALPVVLFSHGFGFSMDAYGPLTDFWAAHGFVVIQPTHLDSASLGLAPTDPRGPEIWRHRVQDLASIVDNLEDVIAAVPDLAARVDRGNIAVAGHSYGATTASALLGARVLAPAGDAGEDFTDSRVRAGVLLSLAGLAGDDLTPIATQLFPFMNPSFEHFSAPALITAGDADQSPLSTRGPDWWEDAYVYSPGNKDLLTLFGADHAQGGIHAYGTVPQSDSDNPATVALVQRTTTAYLRSVLGVDETSWHAAQQELANRPELGGRIATK
ncbi:alpha/beta fold hydrolase [Mycolicibacterium sp. lyk4-40-TYG-92]|jgi:predicted dienelactone hydrolase|uniref:alpha/beta hydrolase family protein n=1 Tax=Mycolicibacterium sp. lyk4-40-TYG-92 TaxID=3040295 RepID=UPI00254A11EB|nr:alpha/beta fold hydrolase [Mycolicibacterium sp. lyk4-40-TYG-92]